MGYKNSHGWPCHGYNLQFFSLPCQKSPGQDTAPGGAVAARMHGDCMLYDLYEPWSVHWVAVMNHDMKDMKGDGHPMVKGGIYMDLYGFIK